MEKKSQTPNTFQKLSPILSASGGTKTFVVMPSWPENQVNIMPGYGEFELSTGKGVDYYFNVVEPFLNFTISSATALGDIDLSPHDLDEDIAFLQAVRDNMREVHGV